MAVTAITLTEGLLVTSTGAPVKVETGALADVLVVAPHVRPLWRLTASVRSAMRLVTSPSAGTVALVGLRDGVKVSVRSTLGMTVRLRDGLRVRATGLARQAVTLAELLAIGAALASTATYRTAAHDRVRLTDILPRIRLGATLRAAIGVASSVARAYRTTGSATDQMKVHDVLAQKLTITVVSRDGVLLREETLLGAIYAGTLADAVDFIIDTVSPTGDVTTWAMNVRTGAVTEYLNYSFNSFARSASGTYLGAGDDGLFELVGSDDAGDPVVADIIGGLVDFSGSFVSGMQAAYLAIRGSGEFFLKLTEATGRSVTYQVKVTSLRTARVNTGKGLRARYFTYELISTGQDFDLLDLTFLPIQSTRRI